MKNAKCTNCGANIEVDENSDAGVCKYCKSAYVTEKAIEMYNSSIANNATNNANTIVNNYYNAPAQPQVVKQKKVQYVHVAPPRPKMNIGLAVILCFCGFYPGIAYIAVMKYRQSLWDKQYSGYEEE